MVPGRTRPGSGEFRRRSRAAHHAFQSRPPDPHAPRRRRTGPPDRSFQPHDDAAESFLRADPPVLHRRLARAAHAAHRGARAARSGAVYRADRRTIPRCDGRRPGRRRASFQHRTGAADAIAGRVRANWRCKRHDLDLAGAGPRPGGPAPDSRRSGGRPAFSGAPPELPHLRRSHSDRAAGFQSARQRHQVHAGRRQRKGQPARWAPRR